MTKTRKIGLGIGAGIIVLASGYYFTHRKSGAYQFVNVTKGSITQTVSITGNTTPINSVALGFGNSGIISQIYSAVGKRVTSGTLLATLDEGDLGAQLKQAEASVDAQNAKLDGLKAGSRPEEIASSLASLQKGQQDLANMYGSISDLSADSYSKATDAIRTQLNSIFSNAESGQPKLTYNISNSQLQTDVEKGRVSAQFALNDWQAELKSIDTSSAPSDLENTIKSDLARLTTIRTLLDNVWRTLDSGSSLSTATLATYQASVAAATTEVNTVIKNLNTESQNIASQKLTVAGLQASYDLKKAGSTAEDIAAQGAAVKQAEANVDSILAKLRNSRIIATQSGIITQFDAKVGQNASPSTPLITIISDNSFEIDAVVPETDIGKISIDNKVSITLDAFPNETFEGSVFYIDPAQTTSSGAVGYKIKVAFSKPDSRMKSGLTANLDIQTKQKDDALILPQYAILQTDTGTFVETLENNVVKQSPIVLGIQDQKGNVEIISGVTLNQQVLNIGLKKN